MSHSEVAEELPNVPTPPPTPALDFHKIGSPPDYYAPSTVVKNRQQNTAVAAGRLPEEIYSSTLPSWRAALRQKCLAAVEWESKIIAQLQVRSPFFLCTLVVNRRLQAKVRSPWLDTYFIYASMLGTHTFFLVFLPLFFFFRHDELGRG